MGRLPDVVERVTRQFRELTTLVRHPGAMLRMHATRRARSLYENAELPGQGQQAAETDQAEGRDSQAQPRPAENHQNGAASGLRSRLGVAKQIEVTAGNSSVPQTAVVDRHSDASGRLDDFSTDGIESVDDLEGYDTLDWATAPAPLLSPGTSLKGSQWYRYEIGQPLLEQPWVRWYQATNQAGETVLIQEYLLPDTEFHATEIQARQKAFVRLVNLNVKTLNGPGEGRDFRLLRLIEAFSPLVDHETARCYLVVKILAATPLRSHLQQHGPLKPNEIRETLRQVLQTLQFLHMVCRIQFSTAHMERGIPHGNLSLDSLLIRHTNLAGVNSDRQFFIHVADLMLWEHLVHPPSSRLHSTIAQTAADLGSTADDLKALGQVGFQLAGYRLNPDTQEIVGLRSGPEFAARQHGLDAPLYHFLCRLIGEETPFKTADEALQSLRDRPTQFPAALPPAETEESPGRSPWLNRWGLPLAALLILLVGGTAWWMLRNPAQPVVSKDPIFPPASDTKPLEELKIAAALPPNGAVEYQAERYGVWEDVLYRKLTTSRNWETQADNREPQDTPLPLMDELEQRHPGLQWTIARPSRFQPRQDVIEFAGRSPDHVGLVRLPPTLPADVEARTIAYDALAVLVPFRDSYNVDSNLPTQLEGHISLDELRKLYTSDDINNVTLRGLPVRLYFPNASGKDNRTNRDTVHLFKETVLGNDPELINKFEALERQAIDQNPAPSGSRSDLYATMYNAHEVAGPDSDVIHIGFDRLSRAFGQCTVYPLAIGNTPRASVQPLMQVTEQPIQPDADLCGAKGNYYVSLPENYPLRHELALVYQQGSISGAAVADVFSTYEAQYLLSEVGLVPTVPTRELWPFVWRQRDPE